MSRSDSHAGRADGADRPDALRGGLMRVLRSAFVAATLVAVVAPGCSILDASPGDDIADGTPVAPSEPTTDVSTTTRSGPATSAPLVVPLERDVSRRQGGRVEDAQPSLVVEPFNGTALVAFDGSNLRADCLAAATLRVHTESVVVIDIEAWVSLETDLASLPGEAQLGQYVIARGSPSVVARRGPGTLTWDVTELLRWSRANQDAVGPFVVVLKGDFSGYRAPASPILIGASESDRPPVLEVSSTRDCV